MNKFRVVQLLAILLIAGDLMAMWVVTDVYDEVEDRIVRVLCLSCIKLEPRTEASFTFDTVGNAGHPEFVLENLTKGLVFLHYTEDVCHACEIMLPVINEFFGTSIEKKDEFSATIEFMDSAVTIIYINIDHREEYFNEPFYTYDKDNIGGLPMFTIISVGYDRGIVKPYYTSLYGTLALDTDAERLDKLTQVFQDGIDLYNQNSDGYSYP
jgi:hypothetical protein